MSRSIIRSALFAALCATPMFAAAQSAIIYGSLGNFDISNDTGRPCHGFEVELDGLTPAQVPYSFTAQRYGAPTVFARPGGVSVRWASPFDASAGRFAERTLAHTVPWFPGQCYQWNPATYQDSGCEHFGAGTIANPTGARARWLCEDSSSPGSLVAVDPPTAVPMPNYYVQPPVQAGNPPVLVMEVDAPEPAEVHGQYGDAQWMQVYRRELTREVALEELLADNPNAVPMDLAQLESSYDIVQDEPPAGGNGNRRRKRHAGNIAPTTRSIVRRIEMYAFTGQYDPVTHEALCADGLCNAPAPDEIGELLSVQMTAVNVQPDAVLVTLSGNGKVDSTDRLIACGNKCAQPYDAGTPVTLTAKAGSGSVFAGWTGACAGTAANCTVAANGAVQVGARFTAQPAGGGGGGAVGGGGGGGSSRYTLTVTRTGSGTVTATPAGKDGAIDCGTRCSTRFDGGTRVTLTATPAAGQRLVAWGGACSGAAATCTITVDANRTVSANFAP